MQAVFILVMLLPLLYQNYFTIAHRDSVNTLQTRQQMSNEYPTDNICWIFNTPCLQSKYYEVFGCFAARIYHFMIPQGLE